MPNQMNQKQHTPPEEHFSSLEEIFINDQHQLEAKDISIAQALASNEKLVKENDDLR